MNAEAGTAHAIARCALQADPAFANRIVRIVRRVILARLRLGPVGFAQLADDFPRAQRIATASSKYVA